MKPFTITTPSALIEKKVECKTHGLYMSRLLVERPEVWSFCPSCEEEQKAARAREEDVRKQRRLEENLEEAGILKRFRNATFESYEPRSQHHAQVLVAMKNYAENFAFHLEAGRCLGLLGGPGQGKTHLGVALLKEIIGKGFTGRYCREYDFFLSIKNTWAAGKNKLTERTETEIIKSYVRPDLLVLDEIGVQFFTPAEDALIFQVIENRYGSMKPTMVISNLNKPIPEKTLHGRRTKDVEDALGFRAYDRLVEDDGILLTFPAGLVSYRVLKNQEMREISEGSAIQ